MLSPFGDGNEGKHYLVLAVENRLDGWVKRIDYNNDMIL